MTTVIKQTIGTADIPEVSVSTPTAPGVVHKFSNLDAVADEIALARIYAGFHYRNSRKSGGRWARKSANMWLPTLCSP